MGIGRSLPVRLEKERYCKIDEHASCKDVGRGSKYLDVLFRLLFIRWRLCFKPEMSYVTTIFRIPEHKKPYSDQIYTEREHSYRYENYNRIHNEC